MYAIQIIFTSTCIIHDLFACMYSCENMSSMRICIASFVRILKTIRFGVHTSMDERVDDKKGTKNIQRTRKKNKNKKSRLSHIYVVLKNGAWRWGRNIINAQISPLISFHWSICIRKLIIPERLSQHPCMYDIRACLRLRRDGRRKLILLSPGRSWTAMYQLQTGFPLTLLTSLIRGIVGRLRKEHCNAATGYWNLSRSEGDLIEFSVELVFWKIIRIC